MLEDGESSSAGRERAVSLGLWGWTVLICRAALITFRLVFKVVKAALGGSRKGFSFHEYIAYEGMRDYQSGLSAVQIQNVRPKTTKTCVKFALRYGMAHTTIRLEDGTTAVRLGRGSKDKVVVYFHGGGYMAPALHQHPMCACGFAETIPDNTSVYILQYSIAMETANSYPRQLQEATSLMRYLFHSLDVSPPNVTLIGDSAGGHLLLSLLLHLHHSNPLVAPLKIQGRIGRAALISPWVVDMSMDCESMKVNRNRDVLDGESLQYWASNFMGGAAPDYWNSHLTVPEDWWSFLPVDDILVLYGENEVLRDGVTELCRVLQSRHAKVMVKGFPGELHTHMLMNRFLLINKPCESERVFCDWLEGRAVN